MIYEGINFYPESVKKSEKEFIEHEKHTGLSEAQLSEAYKLMKKNKPQKEETKDSSFPEVS